MTIYDYAYRLDLHLVNLFPNGSDLPFPESQFAFVVFAFLVGFGIEAAVGSAWLANNPDPNGVTEKVRCE